VADRRGGLRVSADHESGLVDEAQNREVKGLAERDEAADLLGAVGGHRAAEVVRVVREDADGSSVQPAARPVICERPNSAVSSNQESASTTRRTEPTHVVHPPAVPRDDREQLLLCARGGIGARALRGQLADVAREIAEEAAHQLDDLVLVGGDVIDDGRSSSGPRRPRAPPW
jgi:hypothetical protein